MSRHLIKSKHKYGTQSQINESSMALMVATDGGAIMKKANIYGWKVIRLISTLWWELIDIDLYHKPNITQVNKSLLYVKKDLRNELKKYIFVLHGSAS